MSVLNKASMNGFEKALRARGSEGGLDTYENLKTKGRGLASKTDSGIRSLSVDVDDPGYNLNVVDRFGKYKELTEKARANKGSLVASNQSLKEQITDLSPTAEASERDEVTGNNVYNFIAGQEKFRANAYPDGKKRYSIGYGTKGQKGQTITEKEAYNLMVKEANVFKKNVLEFNKKHGTGLNDNQIDALTSFAYTTGRGGLISLFDGGNRNKDQIGEALKLYNQQEGEVLGGLIDRRGAEYKLFTEGYSQ